LSATKLSKQRVGGVIDIIEVYMYMIYLPNN